MWRNGLNQVSNIAQEKLSEGSSGAFMFFSKNGRFIIKTLAKDEAQSLHRSIHAFER